MPSIKIPLILARDRPERDRHRILNKHPFYSTFFPVPKQYLEQIFIKVIIRSKLQMFYNADGGRRQYPDEWCHQEVEDSYELS